MLKAIYKDGRTLEGADLAGLLANAFEQQHTDHKGIPLSVLDERGKEILGAQAIRAGFLAYRSPVD